MPISVRPRSIPELIQASPLKDTVARELDLIVLRENTAGIFYAGKYRKETGGELTACDECVYTWSQIERHAHCAFDLAMGRKKARHDGKQAQRHGDRRAVADGI